MVMDMLRMPSLARRDRHRKLPSEALQDGFRSLDPPRRGTAHDRAAASVEPRSLDTRLDPANRRATVP